MKGTFGRVVTHKGFVKGQGVCAQKKITETEMDQLREEAKAQWKGFNDASCGEAYGDSCMAAFAFMMEIQRQNTFLWPSD